VLGEHIECIVHVTLLKTERLVVADEVVRREGNNKTAPLHHHVLNVFAGTFAFALYALLQPAPNDIATLNNESNPHARPTP
jgi:hypothetical protein